MNPGDILQRLYDATGHFPRGGGAQKSAHCPGPGHGNGDRRPSLSVRINPDRVLLHCHVCGDAGKADILAALGLTESDLFADDAPTPTARRDNWTPCGHGREAEYEYRDEAGTVLYGVTRCPRKCFGQWRPDPRSKSGRRWSLKDDTGNLAVRLVPYRLPELLAAIAAERVIWVVEGERDVHTLVSRGLSGTCNSGGAGRWTAEHHAAHLNGADVVIVADRDRPGREHAEHIVSTLMPLANSIEVIQAATGKDATDHFAAGGTTGDFLKVWTPKPFRTEAS